MGAVQATSPTRTVWRFHVPRIWIRSINLCTIAVKRKSQNLANFFSTRLYLVVLFREETSRAPRKFSLNSLHPVLYEAIPFFHLVGNFPHRAIADFRAPGKNNSRAGEKFGFRRENCAHWHPQRRKNQRASIFAARNQIPMVCNHSRNSASPPSLICAAKIVRACSSPRIAWPSCGACISFHGFNFGPLTGLPRIYQYGRTVSNMTAASFPVPACPSILLCKRSSRTAH